MYPQHQSALNRPGIWIGAGSLHPPDHRCGEFPGTMAMGSPAMNRHVRVPVRALAADLLQAAEEARPVRVSIRVPDVADALAPETDPIQKGVLLAVHPDLDQVQEITGCLALMVDLVP